MYVSQKAYQLDNQHNLSRMNDVRAVVACVDQSGVHNL